MIFSNTVYNTMSCFVDSQFSLKFFWLHIMKQKLKYIIVYLQSDFHYYFLAVYATTAANGEESSYACYYDDERETYLGDVYSVNWMEDSDRVC